MTMRELTALLPEGKRLKFLQNMENHDYRLYHATQRRIHRQHWLQSIAQLQENGEITLVAHSLDCDGCAGTSYYTLKANAKAIDDEINHCYHWAEGSITFTLQAPSKPQPNNFRDYGLEAFEDGHAHCLYV